MDTKDEFSRTDRHPTTSVLVQEREILRLVTNISDSDHDLAISAIQHEVLIWARKRCGGRLPKRAWDGQPFEIFVGGRNTHVVQVKNDPLYIWALRADDPDKTIPGRIWTTEVTLGRSGKKNPQFSVRLIASTPEENFSISPHVPGLMIQISKVCKLSDNGFPISSEPNFIDDLDHLDILLDYIESPLRRIPVVIASGDERSEKPDDPILNLEHFAKSMTGVAQTVILPSRLTYHLSERFGKLRSVFHGAVRVYQPGFDTSSSPYDHQLFLGDRVRAAPQLVAEELCANIAQASLKRIRLGSDVIAFSTVRSAASQIEIESRLSSGATYKEQLSAAQKRIEALEAEVHTAKLDSDKAWQTAYDEEESFKALRSQWDAAKSRVKFLESLLSTRAISIDDADDLPLNWGDFADWADRRLVSRVILTPKARRGVKDPLFNDPTLAARCLIWLATTCLERFTNGGGELSNIPIEPGVENSPCGDDAFEFYFHSYKIYADWHIKSGGNTRDPTRCLRIYYGYDETSQQIVIAEMPAHRRTSAS